jgi:hypothetical protein
MFIVIAPAPSSAENVRSSASRDYRSCGSVAPPVQGMTMVLSSSARGGAGGRNRVPAFPPQSNSPSPSCLCLPDDEQAPCHFTTQAVGALMIRFRSDLPGGSMTRFVVGDDRSQSTLFPERLDDYVGDDNPVRAIDVFVDELDLSELGFGGVEPRATGRPAHHPATLLKIYIYGCLNRVQRADASSGSASAMSSWSG